MKVVLSFQLHHSNSKYLGCFDDGLDGARDLDGFFFSLKKILLMNRLIRLGKLNLIDLLDIK